MQAIHDVAAPAKLNLFLHVIGRRTDGYHLLQSVFVLIDWCDTLHFELRRDGRLARHDLAAPLPSDDLCLRAARALQQASGTSLGADVSIEKSIPSGAGLGGGSSDAAAVLLALNRLWRLDWPRARLMALGLSLGADVPFFIGGRNAFVEGIGDRITPLTIPALRFAVVKPPASLETRAIFERLELARNIEAATLEGLAVDGVWKSDFDFGRNDLQAVAAALCSDVGDVLAWLLDRFGNSRMTGSGSAVFSRIAAAETAARSTGAATRRAQQAKEAEQAREAGWANALPATWNGKICDSLLVHPLLEWANDGTAS